MATSLSAAQGVPRVRPGYDGGKHVTGGGRATALMRLTDQNRYYAWAKINTMPITPGDAVHGCNIEA